MELDDLHVAWTELDRRLGRVEHVLRADRQTRRFTAARRVIGWLGAGQALQAVIWVLVIALVAPYWIAHRHVPHLLVAGLAIHLYGILAICTAVVQLLVMARTWHTAPVVTFQKRIAELGRLRIICNLALMLPWWVLWVAVLMVGVETMAGIDLYAHQPAWILGNIAFGVACLGACVWAARRVANRPSPSRPKWVQGIVDDLAGHSLRRVARNLEEIEAFGGRP
jgi:hypothetical protein